MIKQKRPSEIPVKREMKNHVKRRDSRHRDETDMILYDSFEKEVKSKIYVSDYDAENLTIN